MKKKHRQPKVADDDPFGWMGHFFALTEIRWADTHRLISKFPRGRTPLKRPLELSICTTEGTETVILPAGIDMVETLGFLQHVMEKAVGNSLRRRKYRELSREERLERFRLMCTEGSDVPKHIRRTPAMKKRGPSKVLADLKAKSKAPLYWIPVVRFMWQNWEWWTTAKNPPPDKNGLKALRPREALDFMKAEGLFLRPEYYENDWYRTTRHRLGLKPCYR